VYAPGSLVSMALASDDAKVRYPIQALTLAENVPRMIGRMYAVNVGMAIESRRKPGGGGASPGNHGKHLRAWIHPQQRALMWGKLGEKFHFGDGGLYNVW
jgi:hypothetical protein